MKIIKIINTVYGHRPAGSKYIQPKRAGDPPFEVEDGEAERLVSMGVAVYVDAEPVATPVSGDEGQGTGEDVPKGENGTGGQENAEGAGDPDGSEDSGDTEVEDGEADGLDDEDSDSEEKPEYSLDMKFDDLRDLMKTCGLTYKVGMTKVDIVKMLDEYYGNGAEDNEALPDFNAEGPVL